MLPLLSYGVNTILLAPAILWRAFARPLDYSLLRDALLVASGLNVLSTVSKFWTSKSTPKDLLQGIGALGLGTLFYHFIAIIFGAYYVQYSLVPVETLAWALWMSSMTVLPLSFIYGLSPKAWFSNICQRAHRDTLAERRLVCQIYSIWFGAWASCIVIPLDWDRPWQRWPFPNVIGTVVMIELTAIGFFLKDSISVFSYSPKPLNEPALKTPKKAAAAAGSAKSTPKRSAVKPTKSPAKPRASPVPQVKAEPAIKEKLVKTPVRSRAAAKAATSPTRSRSKSKSPVKTAAKAPSTPKATRSKSKMATPASTLRSSTRLAHK